MVHLIHPYTYKLEGDTFIAGPIPKHHRRDSLVAAFIDRALEKGAQVMHHRDKNPRFLEGVLQDAMLEGDPLFSFLRDPRINSVVTTPLGIPLPSQKPAGCSSEVWSAAQEVYTSHSQFQQELRSSPSVSFLLGGVLEACVSNFALYYHQHYQREGEQVFYLPQLCVSFNTIVRREREETLRQANIKSLSYPRAIRMLSDPI